MKKSFFIISLLFYSIYLEGQILLPEIDKIDTIHILNYWGNIHVKGIDSKNKKGSYVEISHTNSNKQITDVSTFKNDYVLMQQVKKKLLIQSREPQSFESMDLLLVIPSNINLDLHLIKGGEIYVENCKNGVEINSLNGSVRADDIGKYAIINATNGSINCSFAEIDSDFPISLVTMNGEISVALPDNIKRNVRLISGKNGYVLSDFKLETNESITNLNEKIYSKNPFKHFCEIGGGGSLLFMSTENGPLILSKAK